MANRVRVKFGERSTPAQVGNEHVYEPLAPLTMQQEIDFLVPDNNHSALATFHTAIRYATITTGSVQKCSYFLSAICCVLTNLVEEAQNVIVEMGGTPVLVSLPSQAAANVIDMAPPVTPPQCYLWFGQMMIIIYKNVTNSNYDDFIGKRIKALSGVLGIATMTNEERAEARLQRRPGERAFNQANSVLFRSTLGAYRKFKAELLYRLIHFGKVADQFGVLCAHLLTLIAWTEMSALTFIFDVLCSTQSPVLLDRRISSEVTNLRLAFEKINSSPYPQYFRILASAMDARLLERARFPILSSVAAAYRELHYRTVVNFNRPIPIDHEDQQLIRELMAIHTRHMNANQMAQHTAAADYLYGMGDDENVRDPNQDGPPPE